ncbi:hypothetical protein QYF36_021046 [Acer negundo]|nr:hypothetical protein QYF36_021046 [Acer negundo]
MLLSIPLQTKFTLNLFSSNTKTNQFLQKRSSLPLAVSSSEAAHLVVEDDLNAFLQQFCFADRTHRLR